MTNLPIDETSALPGTVKYYEHHLIVCSGHADWPARIEEAGGFVEALITQVNGSPLGKLVRVTACDRPSEGLGTDVLVYPDGKVLLSLQEEDLPHLIRYLLGEDEVRFNQESINKHQFFICGHGNRDSRCGQCGPSLKAELDQYLVAKGLASQVEVWGSSHLGGHRFAGVVVCYPSGNWYGRVREANLADLVAVETNPQRPTSNLWRGRLGLTVQEQIAWADENLG